MSLWWLLFASATVEWWLSAVEREETAEHAERWLRARRKARAKR
ncbi:MAG TPA: hypothetical protein VFS30_00530 [Dehalococcoidia bacterium]|nr:hypothetical protein [Dehalococcoidia bacterium]